MYTEAQLLDQKDFRDELLDNTEVLEKVKKIMMLPETNYTTLKKVAEYYGVGDWTITSLRKRHSEELFSNGMKFVKRSEVADLLNCAQWTNKNKNNAVSVFSYKDSQMFEVSNTGIYMFNKRAILNVGMLLRDSIIAQSVRKELLNIAEYNNHSEELVTRTYKRSESLLCDITLAKSPESMVVALNKYKTYMEEKIRQAEEKYEQSLKKINEQEDKIATLKKYEIMNIENERIIEEKDKELESLNKAKDIYIANSNNILFKDFALKLGVPLKKFKQYLFDKGFCYKEYSTNKIKPYALYTNKEAKKSYFSINSYLKNGNKYEYTCLTPVGEIYFKSIKDKIVDYNNQLKSEKKNNGAEQMSLI